MRIVLFVVVFLSLPFAYQKIAPFHPRKCHASIAQAVEIPQKLPECLGRPFTYLAEGTQAFVFLSEDGKMVLKLFKKGTDLGQIGTACRIARENSDLTRVRFVCLEGGVVRVRDQWGRGYALKAPFILQERAEGFFGAIKSSKEKKKLIDSFFGLLEEMKRRGVANLDTSLGRNFGFIGDEAVVVDFGKLVMDDSVDNIPHFKRRFDKWARRRIGDDYAE